MKGKRIAISCAFLYLLRIPKTYSTFAEEFVSSVFKIERRMKKVLLGLICLLSLVSCKKGPVTVVYLLGVSVEATDPDEIADAEMRDTYLTLLRDLQKDLDPNMLTFKPQDIAAVIDRTVMSMDPKDVPAEDENRIAEFNDYLTKLKEIEASYRNRIESIEKRDGVSFRLDGQLLLLRTRDDSKPDALLKEYRFELKYN